MSAPRELKGVGINVFITNFESFTKLKTKSNITEFYINNNISDIAGARIRGGYAEQILNNPELLKKCLNYIAYQSKKINNSIKQRAAHILNSLEKQ